MSTKTSFKRIALVAVGALGAGLISVAPANAAISAGSVVLSSTSVSTAVGTAVNVTFTAASTGTLADGDTIQYEPAVTSKPADSSLALAAPASSDAASAKVALKTGGEATVTGWALSTTNTNYRTDTIATASAGANLTAADGVRGTVSVNPDKPGVYVITLTANASAGTDGTATLTVYAGYSGADSVNTNTAFMTQGAAVTTAATAIAGGLATVRVTNFADTSTDDYYNVTVSGGTLSAVAVSANIDKDAANTAGFNLANSASLAAGINFYVDSAATVSDYVDLQVTSATAGTVTITVTGYSSSTGIGTEHSKPSVVFGSALSTSATAALSTIYAVATHNTEATAASAALVAVDKTAGTDAAAFSVIVKDGYGNAINAAVVSATVAGPGLIIGGTGANGSSTPNARVATATTNSAGKVFFNLDADGTAGVSTITFAVGTTTLGTQSVSFYGAAAKYTATTILNAVPGTATTDAVVVSAVDAAGIAIPSSLIYAFSSDAAIASVETSDSTVSTATTEANIGTPGSYRAAKAVGTAGFTVTPSASTTKDAVTITFGNASTIALSTVTTTAVVNIGAVEAASVTLTTDKESYTPGESMVLTLTFKDSLGRLTGTNVGSTVIGGFTSSSSLGGEALWTAGAQATKKGTATKTVYAPLAGGPITVAGTLGTDATYLASAIRGTTVTAAATVEDENGSLALDAANAATDAAENAYDEAQNATQAASDALAAVTALAKQVKSLIAQVKKLAKAVSKLK